MQPIQHKALLPTNSEEVEEKVTVAEVLSTTITISAVLITVLYHREICEFLGLYAKKVVEDDPNSLVTTFHISPLNKYAPLPAQKGVIIPRELPELPALVCSEVQKVAQDLCLGIKATAKDVCSRVKDFCANLPREGFIEKMTGQLSAIEHLVKKNTAFSPLGYQIAVGLKKLTSNEDSTKYFCMIKPNEENSIVNSLKANLYNLMNFASMQSSNITHGYIPAEHLQINADNPMNRIFHFGAIS